MLLPTLMDHDESSDEGWRERKRRETLRRVTEVALELFAANGYEATTLDAIAEAAGISRRTFFHYFGSKEEILAAWQAGLPETFRAAILAESTDQTPLEAVRNAVLKNVSRYDAGQAIVINRIVRSNEQLRASNQAKFLRLEQVTFEALCELWPHSNRQIALRMVAMVSIGALRIAIENLAQEEGRRPLSEYLEEAFAGLEAELT